MGIFDIFKKKEAASFDNSNIIKFAKQRRGVIVDPPLVEDPILQNMFTIRREAYAHIEAAIRRGQVEYVYSDNEVGTALYDNSTRCMMIECWNEDKVHEIISVCDSTKLRKTITTSECVYEYLKSHIDYKHTQVCIQGVCYQAMDFERQLAIRPATVDDIGYIRSTYYDVQPDFVRERIESGNMFVGSLIKGGPVMSYVGMHNDDSVGFEFVQPDMRRRHYGIEITDWMTKVAAERGLLPYIQILSHNIASIRMNHYIGYQYFDGFVYWLFDEFE